MKTTAISGLLLAAATSLVSAAPGKQETAERVSYSDDGGGDARADGWVELASPTPARHGRTFITIGGDRYTQLRVEAHRGRPKVTSVRIVYTDGKQRVVKVNRRKRSSVIDLDPRPIDHIIVAADRRSRGTYTVRGAPAEGTGVATR